METEGRMTDEQKPDQCFRATQALIERIQSIVHEAFGEGERWSDFDVLDQGVGLLVQRLREAEADNVRLRESNVDPIARLAEEEAKLPQRK